MELFRIHKTIPFMKYSKILNAISFISFFIAIGLLVVRGLAFSIEFTGGLVMEVNYPDAVPVQELGGPFAAAGYGQTVAAPAGRIFLRRAQNHAADAGFVQDPLRFIGIGDRPEHQYLLGHWLSLHLNGLKGRPPRDSICAGRLSGFQF